ncbi:MAG: hypothetical protein JWQ28_127 [Pedobacter sp.]|jgi:hypothetical protein|nr:hypothetical protein [Pedobacter sp.]
MKFWAQIPLELLFWMGALLMLGSAGMGTQLEENHFTLCPLANLGFSWCPGCGIGRSIGLLLQGQVLESFKYHWFGSPALLIICHRIYTLMRLELTKRIKEKEKCYV